VTPSPWPEALLPSPELLPSHSPTACYGRLTVVQTLTLVANFVYMISSGFGRLAACCCQLFPVRWEVQA
jgi:hypothetical protein